VVLQQTVDREDQAAAAQQQPLLLVEELEILPLQLHLKGTMGEQVLLTEDMEPEAVAAQEELVLMVLLLHLQEELEV
jgi:hypothetical protein